jgi:hypothetical protein
LEYPVPSRLTSVNRYIEYKGTKKLGYCITKSKILKYVENDVDGDILIPRTRLSKEEKGGESVSENVAVNDFLVLRLVCDNLCLCLGPLFQMYF